MMITTTVMKNSMSMTNAAETVGTLIVRRVIAPAHCRMNFGMRTAGAWNGKEGETKTMWSYEEAMYYNQLLKAGYRDEEIMMSDIYTDGDLDADLDDWESDDYLWD